MKLIEFNEANYERYKNEINVVAENIQNLLDGYNKLNSGILVNPRIKYISELRNLLINPMEFLFDAITAGAATFGGYPIKKEKAMELVDMPLEITEFVEKAKELRTYLQEARDSGNNPFLRSIAEWFEISDNTVSIPESSFAKIKKRCEKYITSEAGERMYNFTMDVINSYNKNEISKMYPYRHPAELLKEMLSQEGSVSADKILKHEREMEGRKF